MLNQTFLSVVILTQNRPQALSRALRGVFSQDYANYEVVVVNYGSSALYDDVLAKFGARVIYVHSPIALGSGGAKNLGILAATGDWIYFIDDSYEWQADDLSAIDNTIRHLDDTVGLLLPTPGLLSVTEAGQPVPLPSNCAVAEQAMLMAPTESCVVRCEAFSAAGVFDENLNYGEHLDLLVRFLALGIDSDFISRAVLPRQDIGANAQWDEDHWFAQIRLYETMLATHADYFQRNADVFAAVLFCSARACFSVGRFSLGDSRASALMGLWRRCPLKVCWLMLRLRRIKDSVGQEKMGAAQQLDPCA